MLLFLVRPEEFKQLGWLRIKTNVSLVAFRAYKCHRLIDEIVWKKKGVLRETPSTGDKSIRVSTRSTRGLVFRASLGEEPRAFAS